MTAKAYQAPLIAAANFGEVSPGVGPAMPVVRGPRHSPASALSLPGLEVAGAIHERDDQDVLARHLVHEAEVAHEDLARHGIVEFRGQAATVAERRQRI